MSDDPKEKINQIRQEIDLRLDGLLGELGKTLGEAIGRLNAGETDLKHTRSFGDENGPVRAQAGVHIRMGGAAFGGTTEAPPPDPGSEPRASGAAKPERDIVASVLEDDGVWSLSAELPGMSRDDLEIGLDDGVLTLRAETADRAYRGTFDVPAALSLEAMEVTLRNGILDMVADLSGGAAG